MSKKLQQHAALLRQLDGRNTDLGWFEDARYITGQSVAAVMMVNEFGSAGSATKAPTPARPLLRQTAAILDAKVPAYIERRKAEILEGKLTPDDYLKKLGEVMVATAMQTLSAGNFAGNAESTIAQKGFDKPLVGATGLLGQTVTYRTVGNK